MKKLHRFNAKSIYILILLFFTFPLSTFAHSFSSSKNKTVLITGAFQGIGAETTKVFAEQGWQVWATDREVNPHQFATYKNVHVRKLDVTSQMDINQVFKEVLGKNKQLDVLVNNAAYGLIGAQEVTSKQELQDIFDTNVFGVVMVSQAALPQMRKQQNGHIINIGSTSGMRAIPGLGIYAATKFALEGLSEALASEVSHWNIKVSVVEPGTVNSNWAKNARLVKNDVTTEYKHLKQNLQKFLTERLQEGQPVSEVASLIYKVAEDPNPHFRYQTSHHAREIASVKWRDVTGNLQIRQQKAFVEEMYS